jgi:hypothetical protein
MSRTFVWGVHRHQKGLRSPSPVRDHLIEKVCQVFGVKLPRVDEGFGDPLEIIAVTGQGLACLGLGCPEGVLDPCPGLLREQPCGDM